MPAEHTNPTLQAGFSNPVSHAQQCFRHLLKLMSEPGLIHSFDALEAGLGDIDSSAFSVLLTLVDNETQLWLAPSFRQDMIKKNLSFHCGCPITEASKDADFLLATGNELIPEQCSVGTVVRPDTAATVIIQVNDISNEERAGANPLVLSGPGIPDQRALFVAGLDRTWLEWLQVRHEHFPLGMDLVLCAGDKVCALPRSVRVKAVRKGEAA